MSPIAAGAYPRFRFHSTLSAAYHKAATIDLMSAQGSGTFLSILATRAYLTASGNPLGYDITMPDVFGLAGFPAGARLSSGTNDTGPGVFDLRPSLGSEFRAANKNAILNVP